MTEPRADFFDKDISMDMEVAPDKDYRTGKGALPTPHLMRSGERKPTESMNHQHHAVT